MPRSGPRIRRLEGEGGEVRARSLGLGRRRHPVIALAAGTAALPGELAGRLLPIMREVVAVAADYGAVVVTGGTDAGVFHLLGLALRGRSGRGPTVVGVAPEALVNAVSPADGGIRADGGAADGGAGERVALEPNHDVVLLVPGATWGDETATLSGVVRALSGPRPAVAVVVGGGPVSRAELVEHLRCERAVVVLAGSGRLADEVAGGTVADGDDDLAALLPSGRVVLAKLNDGPAAFADVLRGQLGGRPRRLRSAVPPLLVWPRLRMPEPPPAQILGPGVATEYPLLADAIREAEQVVMPAFEDCDATAQREQNRYRLFTVLALTGGLATMVAGALQSWLSSAAWPGVAVAALGAGTAALTTVARRQGALDLYLDARMRAEALRALYFEHIARPPAASEFERMERLRALQAEAAQRRYQAVRS